MGEIPVVRNILEANDRIADELKQFFKEKNILCLNLMSSPGSGKTSLLEKTLADLKDEFKMAVIEGDLQTDNDARRVAATGAQAVQINTEGGCHLNSSQVKEALSLIDIEGLDILFVENVGNLVCPAEFNVGEDHKITLLTVTEGDDKPEKYPLMFHISSVMILNKIDLLPYVDFDLEKAKQHARKLNADIDLFPLSCRTREGLEGWYDWLRKAREEKNNFVSDGWGRETFAKVSLPQPPSLQNLLLGFALFDGSFMKFPSNLPCSAVLDSLADGVFTVDRDWNITFFNEAASRITGIPSREAVGSKCWDVFHSSLCDGECALRSCMKDCGRISNKSIFFIHADGRKVPVSISAAPLVDADGQLLGGVESFRDLTDIQMIRREVEESWRFEDIIGKSAQLGKIFAILPQVSKSEATALLLGESGTGKELFARAIHNLSERKHGPFVAVNCGALPDNLLESELFGYKAGAFTDARKDKAGRFELAAGGTIFLDEIGDMPAKLQVKLLRVLQEKTFEPLGAVESVKANVRIVAATNKNLADLVEQGTFRQDLYYRLNVVTLKLPALNERVEDIPLLINHFVNRLNVLQGKDIDGISEDTLHILMRHPFPGNVRELENILEFAFILCPSGFIQVEHLPEYLQPKSKESISHDDTPMTMEEIKCMAVRRALERNNGKKMATCRELGISKDTLRRTIARCEDLGA